MNDATRRALEEVASASPSLHRHRLACHGKLPKLSKINTHLQLQSTCSIIQLNKTPSSPRGKFGRNQPLRLESPSNDRDARDPMGQGRTYLLAFSIAGCGILAAFLVLPRFIKDPSRAVQAACQNNLKQLGLVFAMYANESRGERFPELSSKPGALAMKDKSIHPEYLADLFILQCPAELRMKKWFETDPPAPSACDDDQSYFYLGYRIPDQTALEYFAQAYRSQIETQGSFAADLRMKLAERREIGMPRLDWGNSRTIDGERASSDLPVLIERFPNRHRPEGSNVLYGDGHVEYIKWGAKWPMTPEAMEVLLALDALGED